MSIHDEIADLESIFKNSANKCSPAELAAYEERLFFLKHIEDLWEEFGDIPMDPVSETINKPWHRFPAGTHREKIWHWFEGTFNINIKDLLY